MKRMWSKNEVKTQVQSALSSGDMNNVKVFENIVDENGHQRFIEGELTLKATEGLTKVYGKWSLSGSHLLIVLVLQVANTTALTSGQDLVEEVELPSWIKDKIIPYEGGSLVDIKSVVFYASNWSNQSLTIAISKATNKLKIATAGALTFSARRTGRIAFDLLID